MDQPHIASSESDPRTSIARAPQSVILSQSSRLASLHEVRTLLNAVPAVLMILNPQRQVVLANHKLCEVLGIESLDAIYGRRPGEILACEHTCQNPGGCGTGEACATCGSARALAAAERGATAVQECRLTRHPGGDALDLRVSTTPFPIDGEIFTIMALTNISDEKRRQALERIFFHDLLNTAGAILGCTQLFHSAPADEKETWSRNLQRLTQTLVEDIRAQRDLIAAETNDLEIHPAPVSTCALLRKVLDMARHQSAAEGRLLVLDPAAQEALFFSDPSLLARVLGNLVKNALEASREGQTITAGCSADHQHVEFWVHNPAPMTRSVQLQVFQRSFSTKGNGRGLGTYSVRLLTERYLQGRVAFTTSPEQGTTFRATYPRHLSPEAPA